MGTGEAKHNGEPRAPETPSAVATPTATASTSPPGVTFTRSAALGLPSPILAGLFRDDRGRSLQHDGGYTPPDDYPAASSSRSIIDGAPSGSNAPDEQHSDGGRNKKASGASVMIGTGGDSVGVAGTKKLQGDPPQPRKGSKLGLGARARTMPVCGGQGSPEGG